jgi:hypothetical protein
MRPRFAKRRNPANIQKSISIERSAPPMDRSVARLNIEHYRRLLAKEADLPRRRAILRRLAEEEGKLASSAAMDIKERRSP